MSECYIRAVKVQGNVVALALTRTDETRDKSYSHHWGDRLRMLQLYPPTTPPRQIRQDSRRNWGYAYYDEDTKWASPALVPASDWGHRDDDGKPLPLKQATQYWPEG